MGRPRKSGSEEELPLDGNLSENLTNELIAAINKDHGERIAYNLSSDEPAAKIKRWISTGSKILDYAVSNKNRGGLPEGRIIEIFGPASIGKSHLACQIIKSCQESGGIGIYFDTENATSIENLKNLGIDVERRFVFLEIKCIETIFEKIEKIINLAREKAKNVPIVIIWDSIAGSISKQELENDWDKDTIGIQARSLSRGFKKLTNIIGDNDILLVCLNQIRQKIGVLYGDPSIPSGGMALSFYSSVRIKLGSGSHIENKDGDIIGINVSANVIKNRTSPPFRKANFRIIFGKGIEEHEELFDLLRDYGPVEVNGKKISVEGTAGWKKFTIFDIKENKFLVEETFFKAKFNELLNNINYKPYLDDYIDIVLSKKNTSPEIKEKDETD